MEAAAQLVHGRNTTDLLLTIALPATFIVFLMYIDLIGLTGVGVGILVVLTANYLLYQILPTDASIVYWISSIITYVKTPKVMFKHDPQIEDEDIEVEFLDDNTGGRNPTESRMFEFIEVEESTKDMTLVEEINVEDGIVKLVDGSFVTGVRVDGMGMLLADSDMRERATHQFGRVLNTIDYPITVRATSRQFDITEIIERYEDRLEDKDMQQRPIQQRVMKNKKQFIAQEIKKLGMNNKEYSVMIRASYNDRKNAGNEFGLNIDFIDPNSPIGKQLRKRGLIGGDNDGETIEEELISSVKKRAETVSQALARSQHLSTRLMNGDEIADTIRFCWRREPVEETGWKQATALSTTEEQIVSGDASKTGLGSVSR